MSNPDLGAVVSIHPVDNHRRGRFGGWATVLGAVAFSAGFVSTLDGDTSMIWELLLPAGGIALAVGPKLLVLALRGGVDERFTVHTGGLSHTTRTGTRGWRWEEIAFVRVSRPRTRDPLAQHTGTAVRGTIHPRDDHPIRFDGTTDDIDSMLAALQAHWDPAPPRSFRERSRGLYLTAAAVTVLILLIIFVAPSASGTTGIVLMVWAVTACLLVAVLGGVAASRRS